MDDATALRTLLAGPDPVPIARALLGVEIITTTGGVVTSGFITETEAYRAPEDQASHARNHRRTPRTEVFYAAPGTAYVYLCYGIHDMFNVVTGPAGTPHAVLIRAVAPGRGLATIAARRGRAVTEPLRPQLTSGPGVLTRALGIDRRHNAVDLLDAAAPVRLAGAPATVPAAGIVAAPRVGIDYAGAEWAAKPWRFFRSDSPCVSRLKARS